MRQEDRKKCNSSKYKVKNRVLTSANLDFTLQQTNFMLKRQ